MVDARIVAAAVNAATSVVGVDIFDNSLLGAQHMISKKIAWEIERATRDVANEKIAREIERVTRDVTDGMTYHIVATSVMKAGVIRMMAAARTATNVDVQRAVEAAMDVIVLDSFRSSVRAQHVINEKMGWEIERVTHDVTNEVIYAIIEAVATIAWSPHG